jgi:hypothetical protein
MKTSGSGDIDQLFLISALDGGVISLTPRPLHPWNKAHGIHWIGGWVGSSDGLDTVD